ncbi:GIY-YIG nuclease family protein [Sphingobacterium sp. SGG-5]|uniref:GIY-YIG nuclease family protein n=1 Tax=Sphingobacterium sp. SGG-5 TaxID=2710881 RepID=UPI0013ED42A4|nr:GIY-YIG nuclease family protein [Sphingobacterium sp. SGG-5]NGM62744.1 GIY-YIG nuclease family protein [Sphingobacterium sp. SGG-5]
MDYHLYILYSQSSDRYYVGYTSDVLSRLEQHNTSLRSTYTSKHRPWELKKAIVLGNDRGFAMRVERAVKRMKRRKFLETIISDVDNIDTVAQLVRVPLHRGCFSIRKVAFAL